jgi:hypothetical protein
MVFEQRQNRDYRVTAMLTDSEKEQLQLIADEEQISMSELLRRAVVKYLEGQPDGQSS